MLVCSTVYKPNDLSLAENNPFTFHFSLHVSTSVDWFDSCFVSCRWHGESCELLRWRSLECKQTRLCLDHWCLLHLNWKTLMSLPLELPSRELPKASKWWTLATRTGFELSCLKACRALNQCCSLESLLSKAQGILLSLLSHLKISIFLSRTMCHEQAHQKSKLSLTPWKASTKSGTLGKLRKQVLVTKLHKFVPHPGGTFTTEGFWQGLHIRCKEPTGICWSPPSRKTCFQTSSSFTFNSMCLEGLTHLPPSTPELGTSKIAASIPLPLLQWVC